MHRNDIIKRPSFHLSSFGTPVKTLKPTPPRETTFCEGSRSTPTTHIPRAGIPGVAGRLGVPAKTIVYWKRAVFCSRVSAKKNWVFFFVFWGCFFCAFGGCCCAFLCVFCISRVSANCFGGVNFAGAHHTETGNSRSAHPSGQPELAVGGRRRCPRRGGAMSTRRGAWHGGAPRVAHKKHHRGLRLGSETKSSGSEKEIKSHPRK